MRITIVTFHPDGHLQRPSLPRPCSSSCRLRQQQCPDPWVSHLHRHLTQRCSNCQDVCPSRAYRHPKRPYCCLPVTAAAKTRSLVESRCVRSSGTLHRYLLVLPSLHWPTVPFRERASRCPSQHGRSYGRGRLFCGLRVLRRSHSLGAQGKRPWNCWCVEWKACCCCCH